VASFEYDGKGRKTVQHDGISDASYYYDANNNLTNLIDDGTSKTTNAWTFDAYDRVSTYKDASGNLVQYRYDANGNLTSLVYPDGKTVNYAYDSLNRLTNVTDWAQRKTLFDYDLAGQLKTITRPNGTVRAIDYDDAGQPTAITEKTGGNVPIAFFRLNWDTAGRTEWEYTAPVPHHNPVPTRNMTYDDDNRLATFNGQQVFNDLDGNMFWGPLTSNGFAYYNFDARNRLFNVTPNSGPTSTCTYDALNNRVSMFDGTNTTRFVINPNAALSQVLMRVKNGVTNYYVYGLGLPYEADDSGNTKTYHYDNRGSTVAITAGNGMVTDRIEYSAYGITTYRSGQTDTPFLFNGRYGVQTDANGLLYMRARYYNPWICRFVNPDPSGFAGGLNFYCYANGNPISLIDPFGLCASQGWGGNFATWLDSELTNPLMSSPTASTAVNYLAYCEGAVVGGIADLFRLGQGTSSAMDADNGWDVAIGITQDIGRAAGITSLVGGGIEGAMGQMGAVADGTTTLYRAVGPAELADIQTTGVLRNLGSAEGKYFTTSSEAASSYAQQAVRGFGDPPYTTIQTTVPNSIFNGLTPATVDRGIPAWVIPNNRLPGLTPQVLNSMAIPH
jgi:RHS repeat-associated protein